MRRLRKGCLGIARPYVGRSAWPLMALLGILCMMPALAALSFPALSGRVVDDAAILPTGLRSSLSEKLASLEDKSGIQLVVATVPSLQGSDIEAYANGLFRFWKLGEAKANNGLLFLVAPNERRVRIEVGYGLEGTMTDAMASVIIQSTVIPRFKAGDYAGGVERGVDAVIGALTTDQAEWQSRARVRADAGTGTVDDFVPVLVFILFVFVVLTILRHASGRGRWVRRGGRTVFIPGPGPWGGSWSGGSGGGSFGGGSSGGGFSGGFSGGGGSSGGGGASGGW